MSPDRGNSSPHAFALADTPVHLGLGATATAVDDFAWTAEALDAYQRRFADDGDEGRLVLLMPMSAGEGGWERHPAGDELVVSIGASLVLVQELDRDREQRITLAPGDAAVNPPGVWHRFEVSEPGRVLTITAGRGTEHRAAEAGDGP